MSDLVERLKELERMRREVEATQKYAGEKSNQVAALIRELNEARMEAFFIGWEMSYVASVGDTCAEAWEFWRLMEDGRDEVEAERTAKAEETKP